jgi:hypothetical protein
MPRPAGLLLIVAIAWWSAPAVAVPVLGVPMGETLHYAPQACPPKKESAQQMCWVGRPSVARDGSKTGRLYLPRPESRPKWAASQAFTGSVSKDGTIEELKLAKVPARERSAIIIYISEQFGIPRAAADQGSTAWARWTDKGVHVNLDCEEELCSLAVRTYAAESALKRRMEAGKATAAGGPRSP